MRTFYFSTVGDDNNHGLSDAAAWRTPAKLQDFVFAPGDTFRFRRGDVFAGALALFGHGHPDKPITIEAYGEAKKPRPILASGHRNGLWYAGPGGLVVRSLAFLGDGVTGGISGILLNGDLSNQSCRNFLFEDLACSRYGQAGLTISTVLPIRDVTIEGGSYTRNALGILTSAGDGSAPSRGIFNLKILGVNASHNDWHGSTHAGFGLSIDGVSGLLVAKNLCNYNGRESASWGHGGILVRRCNDGLLTSNRMVGNADPVANSDGQGAVVSGCQRMLVTRNYSADNLNAGYEVMDEPEDQQGNLNEDICFAWNVSERDNTGLMSFVHGGRDIRFEFNQMLDSLYKSLDLTGNGPADKVILLGNTLRPKDGALLLEALVPALQRCELGGNIWQPQGAPIFRVADKGDFATLAETLTAVPVEVAL